MIKRINGDMYYFPQCSSYVLRKTLVKKYLGINPCILLQGCFKWHGYSSFKRERKKPKHLKHTYLSNYLKPR